MVSGNAVTINEIKDHLKINQYSVPVYIHELKRAYGAEIESIREGRKVVAYKLNNANKLKSKVKMYRTNNAQFIKPVVKKVEEVFSDKKVETGEIPVIDSDNELVHISDSEMADVKSSLGLDDLRFGTE